MSKIISYQKLLLAVKQLRKTGAKIILATGCFDILHFSHRQFLKKAKEQGDILIVGLESDQRVFKLKGIGRPINKWEKRAKALAELKAVDFIFPLPDDLHKAVVQKKIIGRIRPDLLAVSSHTKHLENKKKIMEKYKGRLMIVLTFDPRFSTTKILKQLPKPPAAKKPNRNT